MDENFMADNAGVAEQTAPESAESTAAPEDSNATVQTEPTAQTEDITQTQAFSRRLNEMSTKRAREAVDAFVASLGQTNPYTGRAITTEQEMRDYHAMREADELGKDPETAVRIRSLEGELAGYRQREEETALRSHPELGEFYDEFHDEVAELVGFAASQGRTISQEEALRTIMAYNFDTIRKREAEKARQETLRQMNANSSASPGSVGGAPVETQPEYSRMSDAEFEKAIEAAKRGALRG